MDSAGSRATEYFVGVRRRAVDAARGIVRWQSPFSVVSASMPLMLAIVFAVDLIIGHPGIERGMVAIWLVSYSLLTLIPLAVGKHYPRWAGLLMVVGMAAWSVYFLMFSQHTHAEINALLQLPLIALYVGWFYRPAIAWVFMAISPVTVWLGLVVKPGLVSEVGSPIITLSYSTIIVLFCFRGAQAVREQLSRRASIDPLTGVLNRRGLEELEARLARSARRTSQRNESLSVAVVDFDNFKRVNDEGGHAAGDTALREAAQSWAEMVDMRGLSLRGGGTVARLGGDEFALISRGTAADLDEKLRLAQSSASVTWSWGIATTRPADDLADAIARADDELYRLRKSR